MNHSFIETVSMKRVVLFISTTLLLLITIALFKSTSFRVISISPSGEDLSYITPEIVINFNRAISDKNIIIEPIDESVSLSRVQDKSIVITTKNLRPNTKASFIIKNIEAKNGSKIKNKEVSFTPNGKEFYELPKNQQDIILKQQEKYGAPSFPSDPTLKLLPYSTLNYEITSLSLDGPKKFGIKIVIFINDSTYRRGQKAIDDSVTTSRIEANKYLVDHGISLSDYTIKEEVRLP